MQIKGTIIALLPLQTGQGKNGQWRKQDIIIETQDQYPKKVCISIWGRQNQRIAVANWQRIERFV
jgi:hypothetical protein